MLYERWREVANECAGEIALRDLATGRKWTFAQLAAGTESARVPKRYGHFACPTGNTPEFIFTILRAWRFGQVVCPLEAGASPLITLPPAQGICLLKTTSATTGAASRFLPPTSLLHSSIMARSASLASPLSLAMKA